MVLFDVCVYEYLTYHDTESNNIMSSMIRDYFYIIQDKVYDIFQPIFEDGFMIGFLCGNILKSEEKGNIDTIVVELGYLLPQYRGQGIFCKNLKVLDKYFNKNELWLDLPNRFMMRSLVDNGLAYKLNDRYIISDYFLSFRDDNDNRIGSKIYDCKYSCIVHLLKECVSPLLDVDAYQFDGSRELPVDYYQEVCKDLLSCLVIG